jgi:hypothetical protein
MDVRPYLEYPVFERLLDPGFFALAQADHGFRTLSAPLLRLGKANSSWLGEATSRNPPRLRTQHWSCR